MSVEYSIRVIATGTECLVPCGSKREAMAKARRLMAMAGHPEPVISRFVWLYPPGSSTDRVAYVWDTLTPWQPDRQPLLTITRRQRSTTCVV